MKKGQSDATAAKARRYVQGLEKSYKELEVLRGVDFDVPRAASSPCSAPTGAGKTTS